MNPNSPDGPRLHIKAPWWQQPEPEVESALSWFLMDTKRNVHCRLDVRMTSLEEVKRAAFLFDGLAKKLQSVAFDGEADDVVRVLVARSEMKAVQRSFLQRKKARNPKNDTIGRGRKTATLWRLNREKLIGQANDLKGENEG